VKVLIDTLMRWSEMIGVKIPTIVSLLTCRFCRGFSWVNFYSSGSIPRPGCEMGHDILPPRHILGSTPSLYLSLLQNGFRSTALAYESPLFLRPNALPRSDAIKRGQIAHGVDIDLLCKSLRTISYYVDMSCEEADHHLHTVLTSYLG